MEVGIVDGAEGVADEVFGQGHGGDPGEAANGGDAVRVMVGCASAARLQWGRTEAAAAECRLRACEPIPQEARIHP